MTQTLFTNIMIFDGSSKKSYRGEVLVQGNRIKKVAKGKKRIERNGAEVVDGGGATLMPGLINGHSHIGYSEEGTNLYSLGDTPPEENTLITMRHAQILYDHGFTALVCAATGRARMDIVIRNEIAAGRITGPRVLAASPELTVTGGLGDARQLHMYHGHSRSSATARSSSVRRRGCCAARAWISSRSCRRATSSFTPTAEATRPS